MKLISKKGNRQTKTKRVVLSDTQTFVDLENLASASLKNENERKKATKSLKNFVSQLKDTIQSGAIFGAIDVLNIIECISKIDQNFDNQTFKDLFMKKLEASETAVVSFAAEMINDKPYLQKAFSTAELETIGRILLDFQTAKDNQHV